MSQLNEDKLQLYINEIETWRKASQVHAKFAIEQYKKVTQGLEEFHFEKARNESILNNLSDSIIVYEDDSKEIIIWNNATAHLFGFSSKQAIGQNFEILMSSFFPELTRLIDELLQTPPEQRKNHIITYNDVHLACKISSIKVRDHAYQLVSLEDNTDLINLQYLLEREKMRLEDRVMERTRQLEQQIKQKNKAHIKLEKMALTDTLTNLPNRSSFAIQLQNAVDRSRDDPNYNFALFFIDLDGFKLVNDTLGHHVGDELLQILAKRMKSVVRGSDLIARIGGDEFTCLLHNPGRKSRIKKMAKKFLDCLSEKVNLANGQKVTVSASIGICFNTDGEVDASRIMSMADLAMYEAKRLGKNRYEIFSDKMHMQMQEHVDLTTKIENAFENNEFFPYFQPICDINGRIRGAEVLSRWIHQGEMISPAKFIPLLEQRGLIQKFTYHLMKKVVYLLKKYPQIPPVSINLSIQQFYDENFIENIDNFFKDDNSIISRVNFEITESMFNNDPQLLTYQIDELRTRGFKIYIDDFGTGYSSFSYIRRFTADVIKIDREFITGIENNPKDLQLLRGMIALMSSLGMDIVIEGVETREQLNRIVLIDDSVRIQGYLFHKPMPIEHFLDIYR